MTNRADLCIRICAHTTPSPHSNVVPWSCNYTVCGNIQTNRYCTPPHPHQPKHSRTTAWGRDASFSSTCFEKHNSPQGGEKASQVSTNTRTEAVSEHMSKIVRQHLYPRFSASNKQVSRPVILFTFEKNKKRPSISSTVLVVNTTAHTAKKATATVYVQFPTLNVLISIYSIPPNWRVREGGEP